MKKKILLLSVLALGLLSACNSDVMFTSANNELFVGINAKDINAVDFSVIANTVREVMKGNVRLSEKESEELYAFIYKHGLYDLLEVAFPDKEDEFVNLKSGMRLQKKGDFYIIGDMLLTEEQIEYFYVDKNTNNQQGDVQLRGSILNEAKYKWPNNTVYYSFNPNITSTSQQAAALAIQHWNTSTNLTFLPKTSSNKDYIEFYNGNGNNSPVGKQGGKQQISLQFDLNPLHYGHVGIAIHEIGHAIGLHHEQCKPNRDQFINILASNIIGGINQVNFKLISSQSTLFTTTFDYESVMLYSSKVTDSTYI